VKLEELIVRRSICPSCQLDGDEHCYRCRGCGTIDTPPGERPDAIVVLRPLKSGRIDEVVFSVQLILEPAP